MPATLTPSGTVDQQLLAYLLGGISLYELQVFWEDEKILLANFQNGDKQEFLAAISPLLDSPSKAQRIIGADSGDSTGVGCRRLPLGRELGRSSVRP